MFVYNLSKGNIKNPPEVYKETSIHMVVYNLSLKDGIVKDNEHATSIHMLVYKPSSRFYEVFK